MQKEAQYPQEVGEKVYDSIGETTVGQMNDIVAEFGLFPESGIFSMAEAKVLFDFTRENRQHLESILTEIGYYPDEVDPTSLSRLEACLMTPYYVKAQMSKEAASNPTMKRNLCEFNSTLRNMMELHPDMDKEELEEMLISTLMWSGSNENESRSEDRIIRSAIRGGRSELAVIKFATSSTARSAGIKTEETTIDQDLSGIDLIAHVPVRLNNNTHMSVRLKVDIKNDLKEIKKLQDRENKNYSLFKDRIIMWSGLTEEYGNKLCLSGPELEKYCQIMLYEFRHAAADKYNRNLFEAGIIPVAA